MLNQVVLVGRLTKEPELIELENGKKVLNVLLAVPRAYKNENGEYDTDFIDCILWEALAKNTTEYCHKGDMVGIKGRVNTEYYDKDDDKIKITNIVAEKARVKQIRIHDFRHSCASLLINNGANVTMVAKYLGHAKIDETLNTYSHIFQNKLDEVVNTINNLRE